MAEWTVRRKEWRVWAHYLSSNRLCPKTHATPSLSVNTRSTECVSVHVYACKMLILSLESDTRKTFLLSQGFKLLLFAAYPFCPNWVKRWQWVNHCISHTNGSSMLHEDLFHIPKMETRDKNIEKHQWQKQGWVQWKASYNKVKFWRGEEKYLSPSVVQSCSFLPMVFSLCCGSPAQRWWWSGSGDQRGSHCPGPRTPQCLLGNVCRWCGQNLSSSHPPRVRRSLSATSAPGRHPSSRHCCCCPR